MGEITSFLYLKMVVLIKLFVRGFLFSSQPQLGLVGVKICHTHLKDEETEAYWVGSLWPAHSLWT